jgi:hypothetical protein
VSVYGSVFGLDALVHLSLQIWKTPFASAKGVQHNPDS